MNISKITPDDPRLTAFALGELEPEEMAAIEAAIKDDPAAQAAVAQIRALSGELTSVFAKEPLPVVTVPENTAAKPNGRDEYQSRKVVRFPYFIVAGLAAACFAVMIMNHQLQETRERVRTADARASAIHQEKMAAEMAKLEERSRKVYEIELNQDAEEARVASMPAPVPAMKAPKPGVSLALNPDLAPTFPIDRANAPQVIKPTPPEEYIGSRAAQVTLADQANVVGKSAEIQKMGGAADANEMIALSPFSVSSEKERGNKWSSEKRRQKSVDYGVLSVSASAKARAPEARTVETFVAGTSAQSFNTEAYDRVADNDYLNAAGNPLSTFSIDVDTASYSNMRRFLNSGQRPPHDAVRIEELVNYFPYRYAAPKDAATPFAASMEVASAPWNPAHRLVRIGLKGREIPLAERPALNLVFLLDVSGSMNEPNKLPLVKESMRLLIEKLKPTDRVAIAVYAGASGLALPSTPASRKQEILAAIDELHAGGSTNGAMGIQLAYDIAKANFVEGGANRVVLCTDGDFNIGVTNQGDLTRLIEEKAKSGVFLTVLGFGMGNYKDSMLEKLADKGNGNYGYVDNASEAKKLLVEQLSGTLVTIAKDVKLQVEFNPAVVKSYRLIGYENRILKKEDFNNDKIDAGEIGAGHTVTALYEVVPVGIEAPTDVPAVDLLKYQAGNESKTAKTKLARDEGSAEMLTLKVRYKAPTSDVSSKLEFPLVDSGAEFAAASQDFKFAAAVASFGMMLRESPHKGSVTFDSVLGWAEDGLGEDAGGHRHEFMDLVKRARGLSG